MTQKLIGGLWLDSLRWTSTYDVSNNMLSELHESWLNGQWVNSSRGTYTYDANGKVTFDLYGKMVEQSMGEFLPRHVYL